MRTRPIGQFTTFPATAQTTPHEYRTIYTADELRGVVAEISRYEEFSKDLAPQTFQLAGIFPCADSCAALQTVALNAAETIANEAFSGCVSVTAVTLGENVETIGVSAFNAIGIKGYFVPYSRRRYAGDYGTDGVWQDHPCQFDSTLV